jgi:acyl-CoA reductase-like NAD-dependent aldehyde dehydrogenase
MKADKKRSENGGVVETKGVADVDVESTINMGDLSDLEKRTLAKHEGEPAAASRVRVAKAYKMYVGGAFVRSESGRYVQNKGGGERDRGADAAVVNVPRGSRKDARDAVVAARNALDGWSARTAYNRGQILYRLAEVMESRREELATSLVRGGVDGTSAPEARRGLHQADRAAATEVDAAIDRAVFYAGFSDKYQALVASSNPVSGPHFGFSVPEPMGVVAVVAPERPALLGLVSTVLPVIATGNVAVVIAGEADPRTAIVFCECLATSDLPGGVVNVLTGKGSEMSPHLAKHREVIGIDAWTEDAALRAALEREGADNVKRVKTHALPPASYWLDDRKGQGIGWLERFLETKSVWHPVGI